MRPFDAEVKPKDLPEILGPSREPRTSTKATTSLGVVTGIGMDTQTAAIYLFIETSLTEGKGKLTLTGNLGDVMKESAIIALEWIKSNAESIGLNPAELNERNVHLHVPQGAIPKGWPQRRHHHDHSAGIGIHTAARSARRWP